MRISFPAPTIFIGMQWTDSMLSDTESSIRGDKNSKKARTREGWKDGKLLSDHRQDDVNDVVGWIGNI